MRSAFIFALAVVAPGLAQNQNIPQQRQQLVSAILTTDRPDSVFRRRMNCIYGREPGSVREARAAGMDFTPDASDGCVAALRRSAKDKQLLGAYQTLIANLGGDGASYQTLPKAIGAAVLGGNAKVSVGNGLAANITPEIAFDAGFTVAYTDNAARKEADPQKLKAIAETCLDGKADAATCFSVGYVYGSQTVSAQ